MTCCTLDLMLVGLQCPRWYNFTWLIVWSQCDAIGSWLTSIAVFVLQSVGARFERVRACGVVVVVVVVVAMVVVVVCMSVCACVRADVCVRAGVCACVRECACMRACVCVCARLLACV